MFQVVVCTMKFRIWEFRVCVESSRHKLPFHMLSDIGRHDMPYMPFWLFSDKRYF